MQQNDGLVQLLQWYIESGVDEALGNEALNRLAPKPDAALPAAKVQPSPAPDLGGARQNPVPYSAPDRPATAELISREETTRSARAAAESAS